MKINNFVTALMAVLLGALIVTYSVKDVDAAPQDILGPPNIAALSFKTEAGSFILLTDGTVFEAESGTNLVKDYSCWPSKRRRRYC